LGEPNQEVRPGVILLWHLAHYRAKPPLISVISSRPWVASRGLPRPLPTKLQALRQGPSPRNLPRRTDFLRTVLLPASSPASKRHLAIAANAFLIALAADSSSSRCQNSPSTLHKADRIFLRRSFVSPWILHSPTHLVGRGLWTFSLERLEILAKSPTWTQRG